MSLSAGFADLINGIVRAKPRVFKPTQAEFLLGVGAFYDSMDRTPTRLCARYCTESLDGRERTGLRIHDTATGFVYGHENCTTGLALKFLAAL